MRAGLFLLALLAGCAPPHWSVPVDGLDRVPLSIWAAGPRDLYAVGGALGSGGDALFLHDDGATWAPIPVQSQATLWWVFGLSGTDVYSVGEQGTILHWDGSALTQLASPTTRTLYGIWGTSDDDLWAVGGEPGSDGVLLHKDASGWTEQPVGVAGVALFKVWGSGASDVFVCGEGGTILHFDGTSWIKQPTGLSITTTLFTISGRAPDDVYAVGGFGKGVALHYDGQAWSPLVDPVVGSAGSLSGVSIGSDGTLLLVGASGTRLFGTPGMLVDDSADPPRDDLHAALVIGDEAYAVGGNYLAPPPAARHGIIAHYGQ